MKKYFCLCWLWLFSNSLFAQGESNTWIFGQRNAIHFNNNIPQQGGIPGWGNPWDTTRFFRANAACDAGGQLQFYVIMDVFTGVSSTAMNNVLNIYHANGQPMANSNLLLTTPVKGPVQIMKKPGNNRIYYIVYSLNGALLYTAVDMTLNNGTGGVVAAEKNIILSSWQTIIGEKTVVTKGCEGLWLIARSYISNQYKAYKVTEAGIDPVPILSDCGTLPLVDYYECHIGPAGGSTGGLSVYKIGMAGLLKASPDGKNLVACTDGGLELYDFNKCEGSVSNARLIDTTGLYTTPFYTINGYTEPVVKSSYYSACFSPDGSKLYATYMFGRSVFQFDLDQPTPLSIMMSKTAVLKNRPTKLFDYLLCIAIDTTGMGDLKRGPDGKIYFGNNAGKSCTNDTAFVQYSTLHVIHQPNLAGAACNAQWDVMVLPLQTSVDLNPEVAVADTGSDTLTSFTDVRVCAPAQLQADTPGYCYRWNTGNATAAITVDTPGLYTVTWNGKDCSRHMDQFRVYMPLMPDMAGQYFGCPGEICIPVLQPAGDTTTYDYTLQQTGTSDRYVAVSNSGCLFTKLTAGQYTLNVHTPGGCDTVFDILLQDYPVPVLATIPTDTTIRYGDSLRIQASGALLYVWWPSGLLDTATLAAPMARPLKPTQFTVIGLNEYGCRDTGYVRVDIDFDMTDFIPNAFSPNHDGLNDVFKINGISYQKILVFTIFNRYGQAIFNTIQPEMGWDGKFKGGDCDAGTYYYLIRLGYPDGKIKTFKGDINLIR